MKKMQYQLFWQRILKRLKITYISRNKISITLIWLYKRDELFIILV